MTKYTIAKVKSLALILCALHVITAGLAAESLIAYSSPLAIIQKEVTAESDTHLGVPLQQTTELIVTVAAVSGNTITIDTVEQFPANKWANDYYMLVDDGPNEGCFSTISESSSNSITLDNSGSDCASGITVGTTVRIIKHSTVSTIFAGDPSEGTKILIYNNQTPGVNLPYSSGAIFTNGEWRDLVTNQNADDMIIYPGTGYILRTESAEAFTAHLVGAVPTVKHRTELPTLSANTDQDLHLSFTSAFPESVVDLNFPANDNDLLFVYDNTSSAINKSPSRSFSYLNGNWYDIADNSIANYVSLDSGDGFLYRKYKTSAPESLVWTFSQDYYEIIASGGDVQNPINNANYIAVGLPESVEPGDDFNAYITMFNSGNTYWTPGDGYYLGSENPRDNTIWGSNRVALTGIVNPGESYTFTIACTAPMAEGDYDFQYSMLQNGIEWFGEPSENRIVSVQATMPPSIAVPGRVEAEDYFSMSGIQTQNTQDEGGGRNVGWITTGDFMNYHINVSEAGTYDVHFRVASPSNGAKLELRNEAGVALTGFNAAPTGGWQQWETVETTVDLVMGEQVLTVYATGSSWNINWIEFSLEVEPPPPPPIPDPENNSQFVMLDAPEQVLPGTTFDVAVTYINTGTTTWTAADNHKLGSQSPQDNRLWGNSTVRTHLEMDVGPGEPYTFIVSCTAPIVEGTYNFQRRMVQDGVQWFGEYSAIQEIIVAAIPDPLPGNNDAAFVNWNAPSSVSAGQSFSINVTWMNTGENYWTRSNSYKSGSEGPRDNNTWGVNRVWLSEGDVVAPGSSHTFSVQCTAPTSPGLYNFQRRMVQEGVQWFGEKSPIQVIEVTP